MATQICPLCGRKMKDIVKHFVLFHDITSLEQLDERLKEKGQERKRQEEFSKLVDELNEKLRKGEISGEKWRKITKEWRQLNK